MIGRMLLAATATIALSAAAPARHHVASHKPGNTKPATSPVAVAVAIQIKMFSFTPKVLRVAPGTTVTWTNADDEPHTVTAVGGTFHSSALDTNDKFSFTFSKPGNYAYFCRLHPQMTAKVVVRSR